MLQRFKIGQNVLLERILKPDEDSFEMIIMVFDCDMIFLSDELDDID